MSTVLGIKTGNPDVYDYLASVQEYDVKERVGKTAGEAILLGKPIAPPDASLNVPTPDTPPDEPSKPSIADNINDLKDKFTWKKLQKLITRIFVSFPEGLDAMKKEIAGAMVEFYYPGKTDSIDAQIANDVIQHQISWYYTIPITFWVALNWWYVWNYTNFHFSFTDALPYLKPLYYVLEPSFVVLDFFNYYLLSIRMDKNVSCTTRQWLESFWDWRPVTFTLFLIIVPVILHKLPFTETMYSMSTNESTVISSTLFLASIFVYVYLTCTCAMRLMYFQHMLGNILIVIFVLLLFCLFVLVFSWIGTAILMAYLSFFSFFVLLVFERLNFPWKIAEMLSDLQNAPVNDPDAKEGTLVWLGQFLFRNFFRFFWLLFCVIPFFVWCMVKIGKISNKETVAILVINTIVLNAFMAIPSLNVFTTLISVAMKILNTSKTDSFVIPVQGEAIPTH